MSDQYNYLDEERKKLWETVRVLGYILTSFCASIIVYKQSKD